MRNLDKYWRYGVVCLNISYVYILLGIAVSPFSPQAAILLALAAIIVAGLADTILLVVLIKRNKDNNG